MWVKKQGVEVVYMPIVASGAGNLDITVVARTIVSQEMEGIPSICDNQIVKRQLMTTKS